MARKKEKAAEGLPEWLATYSDLVTLLMCFFVLLFSMATIDKQKFIQIANSMRSSMVSVSGGDALLSNQGQSLISIIASNPSETGDKSQDNEKYVQEAEGMVVDSVQQQENQMMDVAKETLGEIIADKGLSDQVEVVEKKDFILVRLDSEVFFESGSAAVKVGGQDLLTAFSTVLADLEGKEVLVQGHTDNVPIRTAQFASNWELSTARATNVVKYLVDNLGLTPTVFTATGNGEFKPIASNDTAEGKQQNRRIEIKIMK